MRLNEEQRIQLEIQEARDEERKHILTHLRNAAIVARNRAAEITLNGNADDARKYTSRAGYIGQLANEIEKGKHLPKGRSKTDFLREPSPDAVEERRPCDVCAPEPCKGHEVTTTTSAFNIKGILR